MAPTVIASAVPAAVIVAVLLRRMARPSVRLIPVRASRPVRRRAGR